MNEQGGSSFAVPQGGLAPFFRKTFRPLYAGVFLVACASISSCTGQTNSQPPELSPKAAQAHAGSPRIVKTQGANKFQNVHCGVQDKAGDLWFGTTGEGVYRYDGKLFTQFTVQDGLNSNTIWSILEDRNGNIWFGTDNGACRYDGKTFTAVPITATDVGDLYLGKSSITVPSPRNEVWSLMQDKRGTIWFGTADGVFCYDGKAFTRFLAGRGIMNPSGLSLKAVQCMLEDRYGTIWFGSGPPALECICRFDGSSVSSSKPGGEGWFRSIMEDSHGTLWLGTRHQGVWQYDGKGFTNFTAKEELNNRGTGSLTEDAQGNIWFASLGQYPELGVWRYDGKSFTNFTTKDGLPDNTVFCILRDRSGNLWFGTNNVGLARYDGTSFTDFSEDTSLAK